MMIVNTHDDYCNNLHLIFIGPEISTDMSFVYTGASREDISNQANSGEYTCRLAAMGVIITPVAKQNYLLSEMLCNLLQGHIVTYCRSHVTAIMYSPRVYKKSQPHVAF